MQIKQTQHKPWLISLKLDSSMREFSYAVASLLVFTCAFANVAEADDSHSRHSLHNIYYAQADTQIDAPINRLQRRLSKVSSGDAANIARSATGGRVLSVRQAGGAFKVKILKPNGVVRNISVDKSTGNIRR